MMSEVGKFLILTGIVLAVLGAVLTWGGKLPIGRLPGDIFIERDRFTFHFPIVTSLILSVVVTAVLWLLRR